MLKSYRVTFLNNFRVLKNSSSGIKQSSVGWCDSIAIGVKVNSDKEIKSRVAHIQVFSLQIQMRIPHFCESACSRFRSDTRTNEWILDQRWQITHIIGTSWLQTDPLLNVGQESDQDQCIITGDWFDEKKIYEHVSGLRQWGQDERTSLIYGSLPAVSACE